MWMIRAGYGLFPACVLLDHTCIAILSHP